MLYQPSFFDGLLDAVILGVPLIVAFVIALAMLSDGKQE